MPITIDANDKPEEITVFLKNGETYVVVDTNLYELMDYLKSKQHISAQVQKIMTKQGVIPFNLDN